MIFSDYISNNDQLGVNKTPEDTVFYRQYLKSAYISYDWHGKYSFERKEDSKELALFRDNAGFFVLRERKQTRFNQGSKRGVSAFKPKSVISNNNDSSNAVCYFGDSRNTFYMTNRYSDLRYSGNNSASSSVFQNNRLDTEYRSFIYIKPNIIC
ncbi:MAG: hypothetical protein IPG78_19470 [Ignavibacteria bacterium]|nr:hypothetical protein [Ignavibacteria bacterium]